MNNLSIQTRDFFKFLSLTLFCIFLAYSKKTGAHFGDMQLHYLAIINNVSNISGFSLINHPLESNFGLILSSYNHHPPLYFWLQKFISSTFSIDHAYMQFEILNLMIMLLVFIAFFKVFYNHNNSAPIIFTFMIGSTFSFQEYTGLLGYEWLSLLIFILPISILMELLYKDEVNISKIVAVQAIANFLGLFSSFYLYLPLFFSSITIVLFLVFRKEFLKLLIFGILSILSFLFYFYLKHYQASILGFNIFEMMGNSFRNILNRDLSLIRLSSAFVQAISIGYLMVLLTILYNFKKIKTKNFFGSLYASSLIFGAVVFGIYCYRWLSIHDYGMPVIIIMIVMVFFSYLTNEIKFFKQKTFIFLILMQFLIFSSWDLSRDSLYIDVSECKTTLSVPGDGIYDFCHSLGLK